MKIVPYEAKYKEDFISLNTAWLERFFEIEPEDRALFARIDQYIQEGAMIYFALEEDTVLATCMTLPMENDTWEICKLAALGQYTGKGAGSGVFQACMDYAIAHGAKKLLLISNKQLRTALHLYEKFGFREVPLDKEFWGFKRADIALGREVP